MHARGWMIAALAAWCLGGAGAAWGQREYADIAGRYALQARVGLGVPLGDFRKATATDFEVGGKFQYNVHNRVALLLSWVHYPDLKFDESLGKGTFRLTPITAEANFHLLAAGRLRPYLTGGVGYYRLTRDARNSDPRTEHQLGSNVGAGLEWFLGPRGAVIADVRYHIPGTNVQVFSFGVGLNFYLSQ